MELAILFGPLVGAIAATVLAPLSGGAWSRWASVGGVLLSAVFAIALAAQTATGHDAYTMDLVTWVVSGGFEATWSLRIDSVTIVMLALVTAIAAAIHIYSLGYMAHEAGNWRFFAYISLFTFFMLVLVTSNDFLQLYFGWEGVGLCSYLLINYWHWRKQSNDAAVKAFIVNRVGDFGFAIGILGIYLVFGAIDFDTVFARAGDMASHSIDILGWQVGTLTVICALLFLGAMGKSAQLGLHTWLPDAMEAPTPVSALIHAATMVTAGVFMVVRLSPLFEQAPLVLDGIAVIGALTAFMAATIALVQTDIKRGIAYSTMSQLGFMFVACGVSAYGAAMFHLVTHAFFKALLFLAAGSVIHALNGEQDMRRMGGLRYRLPLTWGLFAIGTAALAGLPLLSGYFSKDAIMAAAAAGSGSAAGFSWALAMVTVLLTGLYAGRVFFLTFHAAPAEGQPVAHAVPRTMTGPNLFLAGGAAFAGLLLAPAFVGEDASGFWAGSLAVLPTHLSLPALLEMLPAMLGAAGLALAYWFAVVRPEQTARLAATMPALDQFLNAKWYFDDLFRTLFVRPVQEASRLSHTVVDRSWIDGLGPRAFAAGARFLAHSASRLETGYVFHYALAMILGLTLLIGLEVLNAR